VTVRAVFFDVGETLVDEERYWRVVANASGLGPHVVWAALGMTIARGEEHWELWRHLGVERPEAAWDSVVYSVDDLYPDAVACLERVRAAGMFVGIAGNQTAALEAWARSELSVDAVTGSATLGVRKPARAFFDGLAGIAGVPTADIAYVGDRSDNDVLPALDAGMVAVHLRRGPWGRLQATPADSIAIESLAELPRALASVA
jgi:FMN phosphatase YigB (HAD superfamily)